MEKFTILLLSIGASIWRQLMELLRMIHCQENPKPIQSSLTTTPNNRITGIEIVDLTGTGDNSLTLTRLDLLDLSDTTNRLIVRGTTTIGGVLYDRYTFDAATLLVDTDITQTIS